MTSSPAPDLDELERLEQKTRRHWDFDYNAPNDILAGDGSGKLMARAWEQAEFIIKLRNAAPALLTELRAAREAAAPTPLAPPAGISPVETAGHSSPDLEPRTEAGRRLVTDIIAKVDAYECPECTSADGRCVDEQRVARLVKERLPAIEAEAAAESGRLREALREKVEALPFRFNNARDAALLETPPAPSDHPEDRCQNCLRPNLIPWHAPSPLWNAVMRRDDGADDYGIVCPQCFAAFAVKSGVVSPRTVWHLAAEPMPDLPQTSPDGRYWDPDQCLWVEPPAPSDHGAGERLTWPDGVDFRLDLAVTAAEMATWRPDRIDQFFAGIAKATAAAGPRLATPAVPPEEPRP